MEAGKRSAKPDCIAAQTQHRGHVTGHAARFEELGREHFNELHNVLVVPASAGIVVRLRLKALVRAPRSELLSSPVDALTE